VALDLFGGDGASVASLDEVASRLRAVRERATSGVALMPVTLGEEARTSRLLGIAIASRDGTTAYAPIAHRDAPNLTGDQLREWVGTMLADPEAPKVSMDWKRDLHVFSGAGVALEGGRFDLHIGSFLCDPERDHGMLALARDAIGVALPPLHDPEARGRSRVPVDALPWSTVASWAERASATLLPIADALRAQLESREQWALYTDLEHPLIPVLWEMERTGVQVDRDVLEHQARRAGAEIARLEAELYALAGEELNLNSGAQLARVLFEKLGLEHGRRTKTGYSTDQATLEELAAAHPFPARLLEYRALTKLKSTYLDALPQVADSRDGRVHTTFNQAGAATGRLSSSGPNLQNIPTRSAAGREIRRAFVAPPGRVLVGADYSQIELRVMAHLSGDPNLIEAFARREDVHASTARRIFNLPGEAPAELRNRAKIVNFGVMYGMGPRSLSQQMGIPLAEAQQFIRDYFRVYARVREHIDSSLAQARARGWVQTLFGRRRYLEALQTGTGATRAFAERVAINMPIQGSAADLMKLAMSRVHAALKASVPSARLLLQVHDELLVEVAAEDAEAAAHTMRAEMETCVSLRVPLEVSVGQGTTWLDVH
jgi:DNA polymerase-1